MVGRDEQEEPMKEITVTQTFMSFERPKPDKLFKEGSQNHRLYTRLLKYPVSNREIVYGLKIANSTRRISEIRQALRPHLIDIKSTRIPGTHEFVYKLAN
jgi:hypothetical protein